MLLGILPAICLGQICYLSLLLVKTAAYGHMQLVVQQDLPPAWVLSRMIDQRKDQWTMLEIARQYAVHLIRDSGTFAVYILPKWADELDQGYWGAPGEQGRLV